MKLPAKVVLSSNGTRQFEVKYQDRPYRIKLFKFQENTPDGTPVDVTITTQPNGQIYIRQDLQALITPFYTPGEEYEFTVMHDFSHNDYYELADERGITFRLQVPKGMQLLTKSVVKCRLNSIDASGGHLSLVDRTSLRRREESYSGLQSVEAASERPAELDAEALTEHVMQECYMGEIPCFDPKELFSLLFINDDFYNLAVSRRLLSIIRLWHDEKQMDWSEINRVLLSMRDVIMYVLEGSRILLGEEEMRRKSLQERLTVMADNISGFHRAADYLATDRAEEKVARVLDSLNTSGYVYEAERQLDTMMRIFSLSNEFSDQHMEDVFRIIHNPERSENFWRNEPFRKAFIRLLQNYVEQTRERLEIESGKDDGQIRNLIEALSIQLLLADREKDADVFDYNLNLATLYRYASLLRTSVPANALRNSFLALMGVNRRLNGLYRWNETGSHDLLASKLTATPIGLEGGYERWYNFRQVSFNISDTGFNLKRTDINSDDLKKLELYVGDGWPRLNIYTPERLSHPTSDTDLKRARDLWNAIEKQLFEEKKEVRVTARRLTAPEKDNSCLIRVTHQISDGLYGVEITDDADYEGSGVIAIEDMVKYKVGRLSLKDFQDEDGNPYIFEAKVKKVEGGIIHFTTFDYFVDYTHEQITNDKVLTCVIKSANQYGLVGISEEGDSVRFQRDGLGENLRTGAIVKASYWTLPDNPMSPYINGAIIEIIGESLPFNDAEAFHKLIRDYSGGEVYIAPEPEVTDQSEMASGDDFLSDKRLEELILLIERRAALESNYMKAFNHLGFARLLARMQRNEKRREFHESWMRLISILHHFAVNGKIDNKQLQEFEENDRSGIDNHSELFRRYLQLKLVSYKGLPRKEEELWSFMADSDESIRNLASLILAYNILDSNASASMIGELDDRINNLLHVTARKSTLHSFGSEDKTHEFKTSLIFPPNNRMRANPEQQTLEIMKELCSLLNADGGKLYLGVNDYGMGVGIENDLAYKDFSGNPDKYDLYFRHAVCRTLGKDVDAYVDAEFKEYNGKLIYIVTVKPYYTAPVTVEGIIYERHGSSKLPFHDPEDIRRFKDRRTEERMRLQAAKTPAALPAEEISAPAQSPAPEPEKTEKDIRVGKEEATFENPELIATRHERRVCPATFEADPSTIRYLQILKEGFMMIPEFYGYTGEDDVLLTLPLSEEDERKWLVLGYQDGTVVKIPMKLLFDKEDYAEGKRNISTELIFADILSDEEGLVTLSENKKGSLFIRADYPEAIIEGNNMRAKGEILFNTRQEKYSFDVLSGTKRLNYQDLFGRNNRDCGKPVDLTGRDRTVRNLQNDGFLAI